MGRRILIVLALLVVGGIAAGWLTGPRGREWRLDRESSRDLMLQSLASPDDFSLQLALARRLEREKNWASAAEAYGRATALNPRSPAAFAGLARTTLETGDLTAAQSAARQALWLDSLAPGAAGVEARVAAQHGDWLNARSLFQRATRQDPSDQAAWHGLAEACLQTRAWDLARSAAAQALKLAPGDTDSRMILGQALRESGHPEDAVRELRTVVQQKPGDAQAWTELGRAQMAMPDPASYSASAAEASLKRACDLAPHAAAPEYTLGTLLEQKGKTRPAIEAYKKVLAADPEHEQALYHLGELLQAAGDYRQADEYRRQFVAESDYHRTVRELKERIVRVQQAAGRAAAGVSPAMKNATGLSLTRAGASELAGLYLRLAHLEGPHGDSRDAALAMQMYRALKS